MDQPFRLSLYLRRLGQHWKLIVIPAITALAAAILFSFLTPVRYTAKTTLIAPKPQRVWRWENKVYDIVNLRFDWRAEVMPLVKTQKVANLALAQVEGQLSHAYTPQEIIDATTVKSAKGTMFHISVSSDNGDDAALLANAMAATLPAAIADIYAGNQEAFSNAEVEIRQSYDEWDEKWRAFRAQYGVGLRFSGDITGVGEDQIYGNQSAIKQELTIKSSEVAALTVFLDKITTVLTAIEQNEEADHRAILDTPMLTHYELDFATLQKLPPQTLKEILRTLRLQVQADVDTMTEDLLTLQKKVAKLLQDRAEIERIRGTWYSSLKALENKQVELKIKRIVEGQRVHQVDEAMVPAKPSQPNWPLNLTLALIAGLLGGLFLAVIAVYLDGESNSQT